MTQDEALEYLAKWRWPDGVPKCPFCKAEAYVLVSRPGIYRCKGKAHNFTATTFTEFHYHKKTPQKCVEAIEVLKVRPTISPVEFMRLTGWTYKGSWMYLDRVRNGQISAIQS